MHGIRIKKVSLGVEPQLGLIASFHMKVIDS
jgi:hypothetical protein